MRIAGLTVFAVCLGPVIGAQPAAGTSSSLSQRRSPKGTGTASLPAECVSTLRVTETSARRYTQSDTF